MLNDEREWWFELKGPDKDFCSIADYELFGPRERRYLEQNGLIYPKISFDKRGALKIHAWLSVDVEDKDVAKLSDAISNI